jgi:hypothetical protein
MPRDEIDELVDSLHVRFPHLGETYALDGIPQKTVFKISRWLAFTVPILTFLIGAVVGLSDNPEDSLPPYDPHARATVTATTTITQSAVPASCARALVLMARVNDAVSAIGAAGEEQLDISHAARQAIYLKDWIALDKAMHRQTDLNNRLDKPAADAFSLTLELQTAMKDCANEGR